MIALLSLLICFSVPTGSGLYGFQIYTSEEWPMDPTTIKQTEVHLYGSSRLGVYNRDVDVSSTAPSNTVTVNGATNDVGYRYNFERGYKFFELSNHLGNVLVTVTDKKFGTDKEPDGYIDAYEAHIVTISDYAPFGMQLVGRSYQAGDYRYGFNGKENDNDVKGEGNQQDYGMRIYDPRIGKFLSVDPLYRRFAYYTPYQFAGNSPIMCVDLDGSEPESYLRDWLYRPLYDLKSRAMLSENNGMSKTVYDARLGNVDVELVYDSWTKKYWFVHQANSGQCYYLKNDDGKNDVLTLKAGTIEIKGGALEPFKTQDVLQAEYGIQLAEGLAVFFACNISIAITGGYGYVWIAEDALENALGIPVIDGPVDLLKFQTKKVEKAAMQEAVQHVDDAAAKWMTRQKFHPGEDCSEIAQEMAEKFEGGKIIQFTTKDKNIVVKQEGYLDGFVYHQVYVKNGYVYDPRFSTDPIKYNDYLNQLKKDNPQGVTVTEIKP